MINFNRDEEKKMGTLVKEDFGKPNRENTMVSAKVITIFSVAEKCVLIPCFVGHATWVL